MELETLTVSVAAYTYYGLLKTTTLVSDRQSNLTGQQPTWWEAEAADLTPAAVKSRWGLQPQVYQLVLELAGILSPGCGTLTWRQLCNTKEHKYIIHAVEYMKHGMWCSYCEDSGIWAQIISTQRALPAQACLNIFCSLTQMKPYGTLRTHSVLLDQLSNAGYVQVYGCYPHWCKNA